MSHSQYSPPERPYLPDALAATLDVAVGAQLAVVAGSVAAAVLQGDEGRVVN